MSKKHLEALHVLVMELHKRLDEHEARLEQAEFDVGLALEMAADALQDVDTLLDEELDECDEELDEPDEAVEFVLGALEHKVGQRVHFEREE